MRSKDHLYVQPFFSFFLLILMEEVSFLLSALPFVLWVYLFLNLSVLPSLLSPVYSTTLSNSWFHQYLNIFDYVCLNDITFLSTPQLPLLLYKLFGETGLYSLSPFLFLILTSCLTLSSFWPYFLTQTNLPDLSKVLRRHQTPYC